MTCSRRYGVIARVRGLWDSSKSPSSASIQRCDQPSEGVFSTEKGAAPLTCSISPAGSFASQSTVTILSAR